VIPRGLLLSIDAVITFFGGSMVLLAGVFLVLTGVGRLEVWRHLKAGSAVAPGDVTAGNVQVQGRIRPAADVLTAPLTGRDCVAYEHEIAVELATMSDSRWRTVDSSADLVPFLVADDDGTVAVVPEDADVSLPDSYEVTVDEDEDLPVTLQVSLEDHDVDVSPDDRVRFTERRFDRRHPVFVAGDADDTRQLDGVTPVVFDPARGDRSLRDRVTTFPFVVGPGGETQVERSYLLSGLARLGVGVACIPFGGLFLLVAQAA
jgi:hypothetical protein